MDTDFKNLLIKAAMECESWRYEGQRLVVIDENQTATAHTDRDGTFLEFDAAMRVEGWADSMHLSIYVGDDGEISVEETATGSHPFDHLFPSPMPFDWPNE